MTTVELVKSGDRGDEAVVAILLDALRSAREGRVTSVVVALIRDEIPEFNYAAGDEEYLLLASLCRQADDHLRASAFED